MSVTTDGFITDVTGLEEKLLELPSAYIPLFKRYHAMVNDMACDKSSALELKHNGVGIISWSTRGQFGINSKIKATTGFQSFGYEQGELVSLFKTTLSSGVKEFEYTQSRLRSAKDVFKTGGHVTEVLRDQKVRLLYDNRRRIVEPSSYTGFDMSNEIFDSMPLNTIDECSRIRFISKLPYKKPYLKNAPVKKEIRSVYRTYLEVGVRNLIKGYLAKEPFFGLKGTEFTGYKDLISFIQGFDLFGEIKISKSSISHLKHRRLILRPVPVTTRNLEFVSYIKTRIPYFDSESFLKRV